MDLGVNEVMPGSAEDLRDLKKTVSWDSSLEEGSRFLGLRNVPHVVGSDGKVSFERNCVSLSSYRKKT